MAKKSSMGSLGGRGMGSLQSMVMKQVRKFQEDQEKVLAELDELRVEGTAGGGVVRAVVSGNAELVSVKIEPDAVDPDDVEMLEDLVVAAVREAMSKAQSLREERLAALVPKIPGITF